MLQQIKSSTLIVIFGAMVLITNGGQAFAAVAVEGPNCLESISQDEGSKSVVGPKDDLLGPSLYYVEGLRKNADKLSSLKSLFHVYSSLKKEEKGIAPAVRDSLIQVINDLVAQELARLEKMSTSSERSQVLIELVRHCQSNSGMIDVLWNKAELLGKEGSESEMHRVQGKIIQLKSLSRERQFSIFKLAVGAKKDKLTAFYLKKLAENSNLVSELQSMILQQAQIYRNNGIWKDNGWLFDIMLALSRNPKVGDEVREQVFKECLAIWDRSKKQKDGPRGKLQNIEKRVASVLARVARNSSPDSAFPMRALKLTKEFKTDNEGSSLFRVLMGLAKRSGTSADFRLKLVKAVKKIPNGDSRYSVLAEIAKKSGSDAEVLTKIIGVLKKEGEVNIRVSPVLESMARMAENSDIQKAVWELANQFDARSTPEKYSVWTALSENPKISDKIWWENFFLARGLEDQISGSAPYNPANASYKLNLNLALIKSANHSYQLSEHYAVAKANQDKVVKLKLYSQLAGNPHLHQSMRVEIFRSLLEDSGNEESQDVLKEQKTLLENIVINSHR